MAELLPIKVIFPRVDDYVRPSSGGGSTTLFGKVDDDIRRGLSAQVQAITQFFDRAFRDQPDVPAVAKVKLKPLAVAKTHRPQVLFNDSTCPIIGGGALGELFVSVQPMALQKLTQLINTGSTQAALSAISAIEAISPYSADDALPLDENGEIAASTDSLPLRYRLFRHTSQALNAAVDAAFSRLAHELGIEDKNIEPMHYADGMAIYCLRSVPKDAVTQLARFVGTQSLSTFPNFRIVRTAARALGNVTALHFPPPEPGRDYPIVGMIDSGTDRSNPHLQAWVVERLDLAPADLQNNDHGSFVAGLIVHGRLLNHDSDRFPLASSKIVDVVVFDRGGEISEYALLDAIDVALKRFPQVKVWNLSLGMVGQACKDHEFSEFAAALDDRAKRHGVLFVVAAGNYQQAPYRGWPPECDLGEDDRICPPADSIRAITVGATAHAASNASRVLVGEPSPFTRRGPGAAYLIKPELSCPGGNCDADGRCVQTGVISINGTGHLAENVGTSFATPQIASVVANVALELAVTRSQSSPTLWKALVLHSAFIRNQPLNKDSIYYYGLGAPASVDTIINCTQSAATLILEVPVRAGAVFGKRPFPIPQCLILPGVGLNAEIFATLLYDPPLDRAFGVEYCRTNISASIGTLRSNDETGKDEYNREVPPVPKELTEGYEADLIRHGYKWSPLKLYYRRFHRGPTHKRWQLTLELITRAECQLDEPQHATLILTIRDPLGQAPVYTELVREMNQLGWAATDLQLRSRTRLRP